MRVCDIDQKTEGVESVALIEIEGVSSDEINRAPCIGKADLCEGCRTAVGHNDSVVKALLDRYRDTHTRNGKVRQVKTDAGTTD